MVDDRDRKMEAVLARAQAAVADLAKTYSPNTIADLDRCAALLKAAREDVGGRASSVKELYNIAHNIKGQGGSFGYPLVTRIAHSLCTLVRHERAFSDADLGVIERGRAEALVAGDLSVEHSQVG